MRCRKIIEEDNIKNIVWFGSYGKDENGKAKKAYLDDGINEVGQQQSASNFNDDLSAIADTLTQKLLVMRGELWHNVRFGLPLLEKVKTKALIDSSVADIILKQSQVMSILKFSSSIVNKIYHCELEIQTNLGNIVISL